mgnify:CR=1 FL=1
MVKKCSFCKAELQGEPAFEVCKSCGIKIWGERMFNAIAQNMEGARDNGDLYQGSVTESSGKHSSKKSFTRSAQEVQEVAPTTKSNPGWNEDGFS